MASKDELELKIEKERQKLEKMKRQLAAKKKAESEKKRKEDAHNKILLGANVLSVLGRDYIPGDELRLLNFLKAQDKRGKYFTDAMKVTVAELMNMDGFDPDTVVGVIQIKQDNTELDSGQHQLKELANKNVSIIKFESGKDMATIWVRKNAPSNPAHPEFNHPSPVTTNFVPGQVQVNKVDSDN